MALAVATVGLLCVVVGLLAWVIWRWRRQSAFRQRDDGVARERLEQIVGEVQVVEGRLTTAQAERRSLATGAQALQRDLEQHRKAVGGALDAVTGVRTDLAQVRDDVATLADRCATELEQHRKAVGDVLDAVTGARMDLAQVRDDVATLADRCATELEQHLDEVIDFLTDLVGDDGQPAHDRFVHPGN
jgi:uncharacterized protein YoxC